MLSIDVWSRLPLELLCSVISNTEDKQTQINWCSATANNAALQKIALAKRYCSFACSWRDLLPFGHDGDTPNMDPNPSVDAIVRDNQSIFGPTHALQEIITPTSSHFIPASYIQQLELNFNLFPILLETPKMEPASIVYLFNKYTPSAQLLCTTLNLLFPLCSQLKALRVEGDAPPELLDAIIRHLPRLTILNYRDSQIGVYFPWKPVTSCTIVRRSILWDGLKQLKLLTRLDIKQLRSDEPASLVPCLPQLICLKSLLVDVANWKGLDENEDAEPPMRTFLRALFPRDDQGKATKCLLPRGLEKLLLIDYRVTEIPEVPAPDGPLSDFLVLETLCFSIWDPQAIENLLAWLGHYPHKRIAIPAGADDPRDIEVYLPHLDRLVANYGSSTCRLMIQSPWMIPPNLVRETNKKWNPEFLALDLQLLTKSHCYFKQIKNRETPVNTLAHNLFGYSTPTFTHRWGYALRRIVLTEVDLRGLDLEDMAWGRHFDALKFLAIYPFRLPPDIQSNPNDREELESYREGKLAKRLATGFSAIRMIILSTFSYWVERTEQGLEEIEHTNTSPVKRVWDLERAMNTKEQRRAISRTMTVYDWELLGEYIQHKLTKEGASFSHDGTIRPFPVWRTTAASMLTFHRDNCRCHVRMIPGGYCAEGVWGWRE